MGLDIRIPIGLEVFTIFGVLLAYMVRLRLEMRCIRNIRWVSI